MLRHRRRAHPRSAAPSGVAGHPAMQAMDLNPAQLLDSFSAIDLENLGAGEDGICSCCGVPMDLSARPCGACGHPLEGHVPGMSWPDKREVSLGCGECGAECPLPPDLVAARQRFLRRRLEQWQGKRWRGV